MMFGIWSRLIAAAVVVALLAGIYWKGHTQGYKARETIALADDAARVAEALQASETARARERELQTKVGRIDRAYQDQKRATATVASAAAVGMRELEAILAKSNSADTSPGDSGGIAGADPRPTIAGECVRQLTALDEAYGKLADKARAMQALSGIVRVK